MDELVAREVIYTEDRIVHKNELRVRKTIKTAERTPYRQCGFLGIYMDKLKSGDSIKTSWRVVSQYRRTVSRGVHIDEWKNRELILTI